MLANSVVFFLFLTVIMPPFLALRGLRLLFNQPVCMNHGAWSPHVVSAACCLPACCEPDTTSWGPRTYTQTWWLGQRTMFVEHQANCEGVYLLCLNVCGWEPACAIGGVHAHFACFPRRMLGWIHAFSVCVCVCVCVCLKGRVSICTMHNMHCAYYVCSYNPAYDVYLSVGQQFYCWADVRISISPSCFHFQMGLNFPCPYCFIMTYFDYLSKGSHIKPKHCCSTEIKRPRRE